MHAQELVPHRNPSVVVLNPNSDERMTAAIEAAARSALPPGVALRMRQLEDGPPVIETGQQLDQARRLVADFAAGVTEPVLVVACHGDPGMRSARRAGLHVLGIGEVSLLTAAAIEERFAVLSLTEQTVRGKWEQIRKYGLGPRCVSVEATGPAEALSCSEVIDLEPYLRAAERAIRAGAGALVLGCAGMAPLAEPLEAAIAVPVVESVAVTCRLAGILALSPASRIGGADGQRTGSARAGARLGSN